MTEETPWLIDSSALHRLDVAARVDDWVVRIGRGLVRISTVTLLEMGYSARSSRDMQTVLREPPISMMPVEYLTPAIEDRAVEVLMALAERGHHRAPSMADLLVSAIAERSGLTVLHFDKDFALIADITGQSIEQLVVKTT